MKNKIIKTTQILWRELKRIAEREINFHLIRPTYAILFLTYRCTSKCKMCAMWQRGKNANIKDELSLDEWKKCIDELATMGISTIEFFGGDALLRKDVLIPLIEYAHHKGIFTEFPTNCNLLDRETITKIIDAGLDVIWISLDGIEETHDTIRGKTGTFARVHKAITELQQIKGQRQKPKININCVISKLNLYTFEDIIPYAAEMNIDAIDFEYVGQIPLESIYKSKINGLIPTPFFIPQKDSILLNEKEARYLKKKLQQIRKISINKPRINTTKIDFLSTKNLINGQFPNKKCYICRNIVTIDPYGNVIGCLHFNNYLIGNIKQTPLHLIWRDHKHLTFIKAQTEGRIDICKFCSNGVLRNYTPFQSLQSLYYEAFKKAKK